MFRIFSIATSVACVLLVFVPAGNAFDYTILVDDFNDGNDDGWTLFDSTTDDPWGPGTFDPTSGEYHIYGAGVVPMGEAGWMGAYWDASEDPLFTNGFLQAKIRANDPTSIVILMMRLTEGGNYYAFGANPVAQRFFLSKFVGDREVFVEGVTTDPPFQAGEDWILEAGAVGSQLSMTAWKLGEPKPLVPQWTYTDPTSLAGGAIGLITWHWALEQTPPGIVDVTYDDINFTPVPEPTCVLLAVIGVIALAAHGRQSIRV